LGEAALLKKHFHKAIYAYTMALKLNSDNPETLNNLAWLYATCEQKELRNPKRALELAQKAAELESSYYILDTLAEAYYVNGYFEKAVMLAEEVLKMDLKNPEYYKKQLEKFKQALL